MHFKWGLNRTKSCSCKTHCDVVYANCERKNILTFWVLSMYEKRVLNWNWKCFYVSVQYQINEKQHIFIKVINISFFFAWDIHYTSNHHIACHVKSELYPFSCYPRFLQVPKLWINFCFHLRTVGTIRFLENASKTCDVFACSELCNNTPNTPSNLRSDDSTNQLFLNEYKDFVSFELL